MPKKVYRVFCTFSVPVLAIAAPEARATTVIEAFQVSPDSDAGIGQTRVVVEGNRQRYTRVKTQTVSLWVRMKGHPPARSRGHQGSQMKIASFVYDFGEPDEPRIYRVDLPYQPPKNGSFDTVLFCNGKLNALSGNARVDFLRNGGTYTVRNAYDGELRSSWLVADRPGIGFEDPPTVQTWENSVEIIAQIKCAPLNRNAGATRTNPEGNARRTNPDRSPSGNPGSRRTNPPPTVKPLSLTAAPANIEQVGRWRCPSTVRLRGRVDVRRAFNGKAIFVGAQWLSTPSDLAFGGEGGRYIVASYPLDWQIGGLTSSTSSAPRKQLSFTFNVSDADGELQRSKRRNMTVTCQRNG